MFIKWVKKLFKKKLFKKKVPEKVVTIEQSLDAPIVCNGIKIGPISPTLEPELPALHCPGCGRGLMVSSRRPQVYGCESCNLAFIPPKTWDNPNFHEGVMQSGGSLDSAQRVDGEPMPEALEEEYDPGDIIDRAIAQQEANEHCVDKTIPTESGVLIGPHGGKVMASGSFDTIDMLEGRARRLANELDDARGFGQAYIEEKHGMSFSEWVRQRKLKGGTDG